MKLLNLPKFRQNSDGRSIAGNDDICNHDPEADENSRFFDLLLTGTGGDCNEVAVKDNSINFIKSAVDIKSFDNDNYTQHLHKINHNLSKRDGEAQSNTYNGNVFSFRKILPVESNSKSYSPISLLKSSPKFRIFALQFKKSSSSSNLGKAESSGSSCSMATLVREQSKGFSVRCRDEEARDTFLGGENSLRRNIQRGTSPENESFNKDIGVQKYLKMIKPLYIKASKIRIFDQSVSVISPRKGSEEKQQGNRATVFRQVCKSLVKSRSTVGAVTVPVKRIDESALQQQDGIQSAILYCKRSYSSSSSSSSTISQEFTMLARSSSVTSHQKPLNLPIISSTEEEN